MVPVTAGPAVWTDLLKGMQQVATFDKRSQMYDNVQGTEAQQAVAVYYDPPHHMQLQSASSSNTATAPVLTMNFTGTANSANAVIAMDSQASECFASKTWLQRQGVTLMKTPAARVQLADGHCTTTQGTVRLKLRIGQWRETVACHAIDMKGFNIILGDAWLQRHKAVMDFGHKSVLLFKGKQKVTLRPIAQKQVLGGEQKGSMLLSALQMKRIVRKSNRHFLVQVTESDAQRHHLYSMAKAYEDGLISQERLEALLK